MIRPCDAVIAQLAEQLPCKHQVSSSSLDSGSLFEYFIDEGGYV